MTAYTHIQIIQRLLRSGKGGSVYFLLLWVGLLMGILFRQQNNVPFTVKTVCSVQIQQLSHPEKILQNVPLQGTESGEENSFILSEQNVFPEAVTPSRFRRNGDSCNTAGRSHNDETICSAEIHRLLFAQDESTPVAETLSVFQICLKRSLPIRAGPSSA